MSRSVIFTLDGKVDTQITITEVGGALQFDVEVVSHTIGDLRALYFDLGTDVNDLDLQFNGPDVTDSRVGEASVKTLGFDTHIWGTVTHEHGKFDVGVEFGTPGRFHDDIQHSQFTLSADGQELSLDLLDHADFGVRYSSVGWCSWFRPLIAKVGGEAGTAASNDMLSVFEQETGTTNLLTNDVDSQNKTLVNVSDTSGSFAFDGSKWTKSITDAGRDIGTLSVALDGTATLTATGADAKGLAEGEAVTATFCYETVDAHGNRATATVTASVVGVANPEPLFTQVDDIVDFATVTAGSYVDGTQYNALNGDDWVALPTDAAAAAFAGYDLTQVFEAGGGNDTIIGGTADDVIEAASGNDSVESGSGNDTVDTGGGDDIALGGDGNDSLFGNAGDDSLSGEGGADTVLGGDGNDSIDGGTGNDNIDGRAGDDLLIGGLGNDDILGAGGADTLLGGEGNDTINGQDENDSVGGGAGDDSLRGGAGNDTILGGDGNDSIDGSDNDDSLLGQAGNDTLFGNTGSDTLLGAEGADTLLGGDGNDILSGGVGDDSLDGRADDDLVNGDGGNDFLLGSGGFDTLFGGDGNDTVDGSEEDDSIEGGSGLDSLRGGAGNDTLLGGADADTMDGSSGDDLVQGEAGNDTVFGNNGNDTVLGGEGDDTVLGGRDDDLAEGGNGDDSVAGANGNDTLSGGSGNDTVSGNGDNDEARYELAANFTSTDVYSGGAGIDTLTLSMTEADWQQSAIQTDLRAFTAHLQANTNPVSGEANNAVFQFAAFDLSASAFEELCVLVDGTPRKILDEPPTQIDNFGPAFIFINQTLDYSFGADAFLDDDAGGAITYSAALLDGGVLPAWLQFDAATRTFSGTPVGGDVGVSRVEITASEVDGQSASVIVPFSVLDGNRIDGTNASETLSGTVDGDLISGFDGNDRLDGELGIDGILGGAGNDTINGGTGQDVLFGEAGRDNLFGGSDDDNLFGGDGNDRLLGETGDDYLDGGDGDDALSGNQGNNTLVGGAGDDRITAGNQDLIDAGDGADTINVSSGRVQSLDAGAGADSVTFTVNTGSNQPSDLQLVTLGSGSDTLTTSYSGSVTDIRSEITVTDFAPGPGGDVLNVSQTIARVSGWDQASNPFGPFLQVVQNGTQTLLQVDYNGTGGSQGWTTIVRLEGVISTDLTADNILPGYNPQGGETPGILVTGTSADETLLGGLGNDTIDGQGGRDRLEGDIGDDLLIGGGTQDVILGGFGNDTILAAGGDDRLNGTQGDDSVDAGGGNDLITVNGGADTILGGLGNDTINMALSDDGASAIVQGGEGDDSVLFNATRAGGDVLDLGAGNDIVRFFTFGDIRQTAPTLTLGAGSDLVVVERLGPLNEEVIVTDFETGPGGDVLSPLYLEFAGNYNGADNPFSTGHLTLSQVGADAVLSYDDDGAAGPGVPAFAFRLLNTNIADFTADNFDPNFSPSGSSTPGLSLNGVGEITGQSGADTLNGSAGSDTLLGGFGNDLIEDTSGSNLLNGGAGNDTITGSGRLFGGAQNDSLTGSAFNDTLDGERGNDLLIGGAGNDNLIAGSGNDTLVGGDGDDGLFSNAGTDVLIGGAGNDAIDTGRNGSGGLTIDAGNGDDSLSISLQAVASTITLGSGSDTVDIVSGLTSAPPTAITDFETGPSGDVLDFQSLVTGNDGVSNPFGSGYARLVQDGTDTVLETTRNGTEPNYRATIIFESTDKDAFTAENFAPGLPTDGSGVAGQSIAGTPGADAVQGGFGDDFLTGGTGDDTLLGNNGTDNLDGGMGADSLEGGFGVDTLLGGDDDDWIAGGDREDILSGGNGADTFAWLRPEDGGDQLTDYEAGVDTIFISLTGYGLSTAAPVLIDNAPATADAVITFDTSTGWLAFDADGNGAQSAVEIVNLGTTTPIDPGDILFG